MPNRILIEELHLTLTVHSAIPDQGREEIWRVVNSRQFRAELRQTVRAILARYPALVHVRVMLTA